MRQSTWSAAVLLTLGAASWTGAEGTVIFDANFDIQPLGTLATQPKTDPPPLRLPDLVILDNASCHVEVVGSAGSLPNKPVQMFGNPGGLSGVEFANPTTIATGTWLVSWDMEALSQQNNSSAAQTQFSIVSQTGTLPEAFGIKFGVGGNLQVNDLSGSHNIATYIIGTAQHFDLALDFGTLGYSLSVDGLVKSTGTLAFPNFFSTAFNSNGRGLTFAPVSFAFDNLVVSDVPGPGGAVVLGLAGLGGLGGLRRRR